MSMEIRHIDQTFAAGVPTEVGIGGRYFNVVSCVNPFTLEVGNNGAFNAKINNAIAGDQGRCNDNEPPFTSLRITTSGSENVKIIVTDGQITRTAQNADVSDRAGRLLGVVYGSLAVPLLQILSNGLNLLGALVHGTLGALAQVAIGGVNALWFVERGYIYGANVVSSSGLTANASLTLFSVGSNTNGAIVWRASGRSRNAAAMPSVSLAAHTAAPNGVSVGDVIACADSVGESAAAFWASLRLEKPVFIAAGKGLFWTTDVTESTGHRAVSYTLL